MLGEVFRNGYGAGIKISRTIIHKVVRDMSVSREIYVIFMKLRLDSVAVREINCALSVKYYSVVGRNVELEA